MCVCVRLRREHILVLQIEKGFPNRVSLSEVKRKNVGEFLSTNEKDKCYRKVRRRSALSARRRVS